MSFPPGFLDELKTRVSITQVVGRRVTWDQRKSQPVRGDMWAPCPFHQEKTPSFHVEEQKGRYYCFGCHEKGDAITFVQAMDNVEFLEAVKILAAEAGMTLPERDPQQKQKADRADVLRAAITAAQSYFTMSLKGGAGRAARAYLERRGLGPEAQARWGLGYAPGGWRGLIDHLTAKGIGEDVMIAAGLAKRKEGGRDPYDVFRDRVMFPINDPRGRTIAFGGRALAEDPAGPKYLNSPQTELFDKSRTLYNHGPARTAARTSDLVIAEGYMDVIALSEAGFEAAVAPLGTAFTEHQMLMAWAISAEPVVALDGDAAGKGAALRAVDTALPILEAGKSLRFCLMPPGMDPDDLIKQRGAGAMGDLLKGAIPMADLMWQDAISGRSLDSPERRAAFERDIASKLSGIADSSIKQHYARDFRDRTWRLFRPGPSGARSQKKAPGASAALLASPLVADARAGTRLREAVVLAVLLRHPALLAVNEERLGLVDFVDPVHRRIADALLGLTGRPEDADLYAVARGAVGDEALERVVNARHLSIIPALRGDDADHAQMCLASELAKLASGLGAQREIAEARETIAGAGLDDEALTWRLRQAALDRDRAERIGTEDKAVYDVAPNGVRMDRAERDRLTEILDRIGGNED